MNPWWVRLAGILGGGPNAGIATARTPPIFAPNSTTPGGTVGQRPNPGNQPLPQAPPYNGESTSTNQPMTQAQAMFEPALALGALIRNPIAGAAAGAGLNLLYNYINNKYGG